MYNFMQPPTQTAANNYAQLGANSALPEILPLGEESNIDM